MSSSSRIRVDANLVVRFVTNAADVTVAAAWESWSRSGIQFVAPTLMQYEIVNALYRLMRFEGLRDDDARDALRAAMALPIELQLEPTDHLRALELARRHGIRAAYDAHYLALAEWLGIDFYTADERLSNAIHRQLPWVRFVG